MQAPLLPRLKRSVYEKRLLRLENIPPTKEKVVAGGAGKKVRKNSGDKEYRHRSDLQVRLVHANPLIMGFLLCLLGVEILMHLFKAYDVEVMIRLGALILGRKIQR